MDLSCLSGLCRVCAKNQPVMFDLFDERANGLKLSEMFVFCIQSAITEDDNRPKNMCSDCVNNLKMAYDFHKLIESSEELFKQMISVVGIKSEEPSYDPDSILHPILLDIDAIEKFDTKTEHSESDQCYDNDNNGPIKSPKKTPSKQKVSRKRKHTGFECHMCHWTTQNYKNLRAHLKEHIMATPNKCEICGMWCSNAQFQNHFCHGKKSIKCDYCSLHFETTVTLLKHLDGHEKRNLHKCDQCKKQFSMRFLLECHEQLHNDNEKPFICHICNARFRFNFILKKHIESHSNERPHLCFQCGNGFKSSSALQNHVIRHSQKNVICPKCPASFHDKGGLKKHMDVHSETKYICNECGAILSSRRSLDEHKRLRHRVAEGRICEVCSMKFKTLYTLKRHILTHTGEKPHKCSHCEKAYAQKNDLTKHLRSHLGEKTYQCTECREAFRLQIELRKHSYQHFQDSQKNPN